MKSSSWTGVVSTAPGRAADREGLSGMFVPQGCVLCLLALAALAAVPHPARGLQEQEQEQEQEDRRPRIDFAHVNGPTFSSHTLNVRDGQEFLVRITDTCEEEFVYQVQGFRRERPPQPQPAYSRGRGGRSPADAGYCGDRYPPR